MLAIRPLLAEYLPVLFQNTSKAKGSNPIRLIWILNLQEPIGAMFTVRRSSGRAVERSSGQAGKDKLIQSFSYHFRAPTLCVSRFTRNTVLNSIQL